MTLKRGVSAVLIYLQAIEGRGSKHKFEQLYHAYRGLAYHIAFRYLGHEQDAEDAVHHAFMKVAENILKISDPVCPKTRSYIVIIVERVCIDMLRKANLHPVLPFQEETYQVFDTPEEDDPLSRCILKLPKSQQQVIWLKYHHGYELREISQMLDISLSSARKLDQRAKDKLRELLLEEGIEV